MTEDTIPPISEQGIAFNAGCDARLAGVPPYENPYPKCHRGYKTWLAGWYDVDVYWGMHARWPVRRLPDVPSLPPSPKIPDPA